MNAQEAQEAGRNRLTALWQRVDDGALPALDPVLQERVAAVMSEAAQKSHRYCLLTQLLMKVTFGNADSMRLQDFDQIDGAFSARYFARETITVLDDLNNRIGASEDPYVSNPLRKERLDDSLKAGRGGDLWSALFEVLAAVDADPTLAEPALLRALAIAKDRPLVPQTPSAAPVADPTDLSQLAETTGMDPDLVLDILAVLETDQPQVILAGPPGTSKTHVAVAMAQYLTNDETKRRVVQFHASYGYEEFIEGLRPVADAGALSFEVTPGVIRRASEGLGEDERFVLVLDEMNRANLPRVLGELLYALERRGEPVDLMYSEQFRLPKGIVLIGTMNTADRSIRSIDAAVRRRFSLFEFAPSRDVLARFYEAHDNEVDDLLDGFDDLNAQLTALIDRHHTVGHTFFMAEDGMTHVRLRQVWDRQVRPLIEEYLFDQPEQLSQLDLHELWPSSASE